MGHEEPLEEKKVEYIELIYDLIFVFLIGKNATLLDRVEAGFITWATFANYIASSLIVLQIWNDTALYINRFGKNSVSDKLMMLVNMFLLYIMGSNTIHGWDVHYGAFMGAWALILVNLAARYLAQLRAAAEARVRKHVRRSAAMLLTQAAFIGASIPIYRATGRALGPWAVLIGLLAAPLLAELPTNFAHLTERVMLYVVFTFGEMILIVAEYFSDGLTWETLYFALVSFLLVAGLFFSYGYVYDRLLDRSGERGGGLYTALHIFIILALSCVTTSLEFMRDPAVDSPRKTMMMAASLLVFFLCLALTERWSYQEYRFRGGFLALLAAEFVGFAAAMTASAGTGGYVTAAIALVFVYVQLVTLLLSDMHTRAREKDE